MTSHVGSDQPLRVLVVDGDASCVRVVREQLRSIAGPSAELLHASALAHADQIMADGNVDLILLNAVLQDGSGPDWLATLRDLGQTVPVVLLSMIEGETALAAAVAAGAQDHVVPSAADPTAIARVLRHAVERQRLQEQLRQIRARFGNLLEQTRDLIAVVDLDGSVVYASPVAERLLGVKTDDLIGTRLWDRVHLDDVLPVQAIILQLATEPGAVREFEFRALHADGTWRTFEAAGRALVDGARQQIVINACDVSAGRRAEQSRHQHHEDLSQTQRLEVIGRFAAGVAHDFGGMLTEILGSTDRVLNQSLDDRQRRAETESIRQVALRAAGLSRQLLDVTRRETGMPVDLHVADTLAGVCRLLAPLFDDTRLEVIAEPDLGAVRIDPSQLEQVLLHLVSQARQATPGGDRITIRATPVTLAEPLSMGTFSLAAGSYVVISVGDSRDPSDGDHAFEAVVMTTAANSAIGLDQSTISTIVRSNGGGVEWRRGPLSRHTARVYLPRVAVLDPPSLGRADTSGTTAVTETVLLVEDEEEVRLLVRDMLELAGYTVLEAAGPRIAEAICGNHPEPIHLLLTDVVMPDMNGRELADRVRAMRPATKALFMSGYPQHPGSASEPSALDGEYLAKPFDLRTLLARVRSVLDGLGVSDR